jgi:hypothetical protein
VWFVGVFGEDKRVHEAFSRRKKGDRERERERERRGATYTDGIGWLRYFAGYVLLIMGR